MLLSRDAIAAAMETCSAEDYYKPAHAHIFEAINVLYNQGEPADPVTVADELSRAGLLESCGGLSALVSLQADTPATTNAARYARIVEEHALLRRLIAVAGEIAEMGYGVPDDVAAAMDQAESLVFNVAERRVTDSLKGLPELLTASMDRLEQLFDRNETITGVPTGYVDLDERLFGLQPNALVIVGARPAVGKCLSAETRVLDAQTGEMATIEELFRRQQRHPRPFQVASLRADRRLEPRYVTAFVDDGVKPVYRVTTRLGRTVRTTASHPFLTPTGWTRLADIPVGTRIGVPRVLRTDASERMDPAELKLVAYLLGDGSWGGSSPQMTIASRPMLADLTAAAGSLGVKVVPAMPAKGLMTDGRGLDYRLSTDRGRPNPVVDLLRRHGIWECGAADKRVPPAVFCLELRQVAVFLNRLFATDGWAWCSYEGDGYGRIGYRSISHQLVRDVQHLLLRFGINGRIRFKSVDYKGTRRPGWELELLSRADIARFCGFIGIFSKEAAVDRVLDMVLIKKEMGWTSDTLPVEAWDAILAAKGRRSWASVRDSVAGRREDGYLGTRRPRGEAVALLADAVDDDERKDQALSEIYWDEIVGIVPDGDAQVYDLTVPDTHNFVADDILVHNTAFALGLAAHAAVEARVPTLVFSLEMGAEEITNRLLVSEARVDANRMRNGQLREPDWPKISTAVARLGDAPLYVDDNPNTTIMEIRAKARRLKARQGGLGLIVVDYLQLMSGGSTAENRQLEVSSISRGLKILARELEVPVVALSQLSRQLEQRADKRPTLADLRESGSLEQDADVVMFLYRDEIYNPDSADRGIAEVIVAKHRNGPTGKIQLSFLEQYTKFVNMARV
jgi:replicative DNA helicase